MQIKLRPDQIYLWILLILFAGIHLIHGQNHVADPDEFQTLTNAFDASRGLVPYVDFWDNHGPLSIWILRPVLRVWTGGHELIYWLRGVVWINTLIISGLVFWLVRRLLPMVPAAPWIATVFLLSAPPFLSKAIELRGDNPANLLAALALTTLIVARHTQKRILFFVVGLCLGFMAGFTLKVVVATSALGLFYVCWHLRDKRLTRPVEIGYIAAGIALPVLIMGLILAVSGSLSGFFSCYLGGNITRESADISSSELIEVYKKAPVWALLATAIIATSLTRVFTGRADGVETGLTAMCVAFVAQFVFLLPTKNMQSLLPLYVPLALLSGYAVGSFANFRFRGNKLFAALVIVLPLLLVRDLDGYSRIRNTGLSEQVAFANQALGRTVNEDYIFDPSGIVWLKPKPGSFHVLVTFIRQMHQSGTIDLQIPDLLEHYEIRTVVFDRRTKDLRISDIDLFTSKYTAVLKGQNCWLLVRKDKSSETATRIAANGLKHWTHSAYEKAEAPTKALNPPKWYTGFLQK